MQISGKVGVITGAASGIGRAAAAEFHRQEIGALALVDLADSVHDIAAELSAADPARPVRGFQGDTTDDDFRRSVFETMKREHGPINICVPAAGITRDALAVKLNRERKKAHIYPV